MTDYSIAAFWLSIVMFVVTLLGVFWLHWGWTFPTGVTGTSTVFLFLYGVGGSAPKISPLGRGRPQRS
jgi:hypothetical protein